MTASRLDAAERRFGRNDGAVRHTALASEATGGGGPIRFGRPLGAATATLVLQV
jgi:hypothetical protein